MNLRNKIQELAVFLAREAVYADGSLVGGALVGYGVIGVLVNLLSFTLLGCLIENGKIGGMVAMLALALLLEINCLFIGACVKSIRRLRKERLQTCTSR